MSISFSTLGALWPKSGKVYVTKYVDKIDVDFDDILRIDIDMKEMPEGVDTICSSAETLIDVSMSTIQHVDATVETEEDFE